MGFLSNLLYTEKAAKSQNTYTEFLARYFGFGGRYGTPLLLSGDRMTFEQAARLGYKSIPWVRACIDLIGTSLGMIEWKVYKVGSNDPIKKHDIEVLLNRPNPHTTRTELFMNIAASLSLSGNCYLQKVLVTDRTRSTKQGTKPRELWILRPDWVAPIPDPQLFISGYRLIANNLSDFRDFTTDEMFQLKYPDPLNPYIGVSPLASAYRSVQGEEAAHSWNQALMENYAQPSGALMTEQQLTPTSRKQLIDEISDSYSGDNRFLPMVLWGGMKWQQISLTPTDVQFIAQRDITKQEICAVIGVPAEVVGAIPDPSHSNKAVARLAFWEDKIMPMASWLQTVFNAELVHPYYGEEVEIRPEYSHIPALRKALEDKLNLGKTMVAMGWPLNAVNEHLRIGMPNVAWGDVSWMSTSVMPVNSPELDMLPEPSSDPAALPGAQDPKQIEAPKDPTDGNRQPTGDPAEQDSED